MFITGQNAYFVRISVGAKNNIMHLVVCLLDTRAGPILIENDFMPARHLLKSLNQPSGFFTQHEKALSKLLDK